jgi:hypothetical protein
MNFNKDNNIEEAKPKFCSVQLEPCIPRSMSRSDQTKNLPHAHQKNMSCRSQKIQMIHKETKTTRWPVMVAKTIPIYGLQRGTVLINNEPLIVSSRIEEFLRLRSVKAEFDTNHAEVMCTTSDFLQYKIYLYACPKNDKSTYVEVMMMGGCGCGFQRERKAIIDTAKGLVAAKDTSNFSKKFKIPSSMKGLYVAPSTNDLENVLYRAIDQIHSNDRNTALFALQNLAFMTNIEKAHSETANKFSRLIMKSRSGVIDMIVSIYASQTSNMNGKMSEQICDACLCILVNIINSLPKNDRFLDQECENFIESFIHSLLHDLERLECTHRACLVLRCLSLLVENSSMACAIVQRTNIGSFVEKAVELGREEHFLLEQTAMSTINVFQHKMIVV